MLVIFEVFRTTLPTIPTPHPQYPTLSQAIIPSLYPPIPTHPNILLFPTIALDLSPLPF